jgi:hypothetical protein
MAEMEEREGMQTAEERCCPELNDPCTCYYPVEPCEDKDSGCTFFMDPCCC